MTKIPYQLWICSPNWPLYSAKQDWKQEFYSPEAEECEKSMKTCYSSSGKYVVFNLYDPLILFYIFHSLHTKSSILQVIFSITWSIDGMTRWPLYSSGNKPILFCDPYVSLFCYIMHHYLYKFQMIKDKISAKCTMHMIFIKSREANKVCYVETFAIR